MCMQDLQIQNGTAITPMSGQYDANGLFHIGILPDVVMVHGRDTDDQFRLVRAETPAVQIDLPEDTALSIGLDNCNVYTRASLGGWIHADLHAAGTAGSTVNLWVHRLTPGVFQQAVIPIMRS